MNAQHATAVLARYKALQCVRAKYREAGIKITGIKASQLREEAVAYIEAHPEVMEWALGAQATLSEPKSKA